ncbi:MAG: DUF167 domain-containing protein [Candidatus Omnitrophica bacterium]|nr:DUF167 domain-containing protein [Candidatus Omnitrophota bacterium]
MKTIRVRVQPRSRVTKVMCTGQGEYKVYTPKPAIDGEANKAVIGLIAEHLGLKRSQVAITGGEKARNKVLEIRGM